jgi:hypothetical protein
MESEAVFERKDSPHKSRIKGFFESLIHHNQALHEDQSKAYLNDDELMRAESSPNNHHCSYPIATSNMVLFEQDREEINDFNI